MRLARLHQDGPHHGGLVSRHVELEPALSGISGRPNQDRDTAERRFAVVVVLELPEIQPDRLHHGIGSRPLQGKEGRPVAGIIERNV